MLRKILLLIVVSFLTLGSAAAGFYLYYQSNPPAKTVQLASPVVLADRASAGVVGNHRPDFSLADVSGRLRKISEWDGQVIVLNFWATWCPPCLKEIPEFIHLQEKYGNQGLQFIGIAMQQAEKVTGFMQEHGMNYPVLAGELEVVKLAEAYGNQVGALPYTVIIDRQGRIVHVKNGVLPRQDAEAVITKHL